MVAMIPEDSQSVASMADTDSNHNSSTNFVVKLQSEERATLARKETKAVTVVRFIIFVVLFIAACVVCLLVFLISRADEREDFEIEFADYANKVIQSYTGYVGQQLGALDTLSIGITSHAHKSGETFPFVTFPDFSLRGAATRVLCGGVVILYAPLVLDQEREKWESYVKKNRGWIVDQSDVDTVFRGEQDEKFGVELPQQNGQPNQSPSGPPPSQNASLSQNNATPSNNASQSQNGPPPEGQLRFRERIFGADMRDPIIMPGGSGPFLPVWQFSPIMLRSSMGINYDQLSRDTFTEPLSTLIKTGKAVYNEFKIPENTNLYSVNLQIGQFRHDMVEYAGDPTTNLFYPVFGDFGKNKSISGVLITSLYFRLYFANVLPANARGIHCVLENSLNQTMTYLIDGPDAIFVGEGDHHDSRYDHMEVSTDITKFLQQKSAPDTASYTVVDLDDEYCTYKLRVYPSAATEEVFLSNEPMLGAVIVAVVFLITSAVFLLYDLLVERRQNIVMNRAAASGAIVSSLFPKNVRERLMEETAETKKDLKKNNSKIGDPRAWLSTDNEKQVLDEEHIVDGPGEAIASKPIADLYPATTILFADLAGFTAWSSKRTPQDVFVLLETVYNAFDKIAVKRGVYKIETIGDCYVAVTGLPDPQDDHAVIMVKFAYGAMNKFIALTHSLKDTLGDGTCDLQLRAGLHSGSVTAGVLRGQKSRFQLFGDSMNTASRMESNGVPGRIHVSQATADELVAKGKSHWLTAREDKIVAKGKGEMQTYFVELSGDSRSGRFTAITDSERNVGSERNVESEREFQ